MCEVSKIVEELRKNPVFRMSLASKELFHSNMLAWLLESCDSDDNLLSEIAKALARLFMPKQDSEKDYKVLTVLREKSHLDLIIVFLPDNNDFKDDWAEIEGIFQNSYSENRDLLEKLEKSCRFVVVENKFKSIPSKEQLEKYDKVIEKGIWFEVFKVTKKTKFSIVLNEENTTRYLMAPQVALENFKEYQKCQECRERPKWLPLPYEKIWNVLQSKIDDTAEDFTATFIKHYANFLENMLKLTEDIEKKLRSTDNPAFPKPEDIRELKKIRIHDFYEKLWFSVLLNRIEITNEDKIEDKIKKGSGYTNALGLLDFKFIGCSDLVWYGIQIQNKQLRIVVEPKWGNKWQGEYPKKQIIDYCQDILKLMNEQQPYTAFEFKNTKDLCSFGDFKYKYIPLTNNISIKNLEGIVNKAWTAILNSTLKNLTLSQQNDNENIQ